MSLNDLCKVLGFSNILLIYHFENNEPYHASV